MRIWLMLLSLLLVCALAVEAPAKGKGGGKKGGGGKKAGQGAARAEFDAMDTNHDGTVSEAEFVAAHKKLGSDLAKALFKKLGGTKEKGLSFEQFKKSKKKVAPVSSAELDFKTMDKDGDGKLSLDEFAAGKDRKTAERKFKYIDKDQDGFVSREEYLASQPPPPATPTTTAPAKHGGGKRR